MLLQEVNDLEYNVELTEEKKDGKKVKKIKLKGVFQKADTPNKNKRVYPKKVLEKVIKESQEALEERRMVGELDHPPEAKIHLDKISHVITKLEMRPDGVVYGEAEVLPTPAGRILEALIKSNVKLGISSRGYGSVKKSKEGLNEVQEDYKLITFDIVNDPSTPNAFPDPVLEHNEVVINTTTLQNIVGEVFK